MLLCLGQVCPQSLIMGLVMMGKTAGASGGLSVDIDHAPHMVWLPRQAVYTAVNIDRPLFFRDGRYYLPFGTHWYVAKAYTGPWRPRARAGLPRALRSFNLREWSHWQRVALAEARRAGDRRDFVADHNARGAYERATYGPH